MDSEVVQTTDYKGRLLEYAVCLRTGHFLTELHVFYDSHMGYLYFKYFSSLSFIIHMQTYYFFQVYRWLYDF